MSFRVSQRDDRRRRMMTSGVETHPLAGERRSSSAVPNRKPSAADLESPAYSSAALPAEQPRILDFVPLCPWKVTTLLLAIATVVVGLATVDTWLPVAIANHLAGTALDLTAPVSLASWFSSAMLLAASALALVVYSIRAHKLDDYRGRYRVWRQAAIGWLVFSIAVGAGACSTIETLMVATTGGKLAGNVALWWAIPAAAIVGYFVPALLADLSRCRLGSTLLIAAVLMWAFATASKLRWLPLDPSEQLRIEATVLITGHCLLLMAMTLYARYVIRESQGLITLKQSKNVETDLDENSSEEADRRRTKVIKKKLVEEVDEENSDPPQKHTRRFFKFGRRKQARVDSSHDAEEPASEPHIEPRKVAAPKSTTQQRKLAPTPATPTAVAQPKAKIVATKAKKRASIPDTHDDPIATEIARLEGLGGRLSKSQRKKLRKLRRQTGQGE